MRRIRFEFKAKAIKKRKVNILINLNGVTVTLKKRKKGTETEDTEDDDDSIPKTNSFSSTPKPHSKNCKLDDSKMTLLQHPIYRIFYVSHDSQDLKIFSYICRDGLNTPFRCNVFKSYKKSQAMRIVRTIGQAFEVCHRYNSSKEASVASDEVTSKNNFSASPEVEVKPPIERPSPPSSPKVTSPLPPARTVETGDRADMPSSGSATPTNQPKPEAKEKTSTEKSQSNLDTLLQVQQLVQSLSLPSTTQPFSPSDEKMTFAQMPFASTASLPPSMSFIQHMFQKPQLLKSPIEAEPGRQPPESLMPLTSFHQSKDHLHVMLQLTQEQLTQQQSETQVAIAQVHLLKDQLAAESAARIEAQARVHQLLLYNRELLIYIQQLINTINQIERNPDEEVRSRTIPRGHSSSNMMPVTPVKVEKFTPQPQQKDFPINSEIETQTDWPLIPEPQLFTNKQSQVEMRSTHSSSTSTSRSNAESQSEQHEECSASSAATREDPWTRQQPAKQQIISQASLDQSTDFPLPPPPPILSALNERKLAGNSLNESQLLALAAMDDGQLASFDDMLPHSTISDNVRADSLRHLPAAVINAMQRASVACSPIPHLIEMCNAATSVDNVDTCLSIDTGVRNTAQGDIIINRNRPEAISSHSSFDSDFSASGGVAKGPVNGGGDFMKLSEERLKTALSDEDGTSEDSGFPRLHNNVSASYLLDDINENM